MQREVRNMDLDWQFHLGDIFPVGVTTHATAYTSTKGGNASGPAGKSYDDTLWQRVNLPHDYLYSATLKEENGPGRGYRTPQNSWYRKTFLLSPDDAGKVLTLRFEGISTNAMIWFNGSLMARSFSVYAESVFDITDRAYFDGRPNVLAVYVKGDKNEGWWYEGCGIYRHVRLFVTAPLHVGQDGIFAKPVLRESTANDWCVETEITLENGGIADGKAAVRATLSDGETVLATAVSDEVAVGAWDKRVLSLRLPVEDPRRWDVDDPYLYTVKVEVLQNGAAVDSDTVRIGFRTIAMDKDRGFILNGRPLKVLGTCNHQDHAGVGVAVPYTVWRFRLERLKEMGTNAYRCSHNLPAREVLDLCDELGLLVMDENRRFEATDYVLSCVENMVRRDRNHPSVVFWSMFNEEPLQNTEEGARIYRHMRHAAQKLDDTRIFTGAINSVTVSSVGAASLMDAVGINYALGHHDAMRKEHPDWAFIGSENNSAVTTRGCYESDYRQARVLSNYDEEAVTWGSNIRDMWAFTRANDWFAGIFVWTGFDYRGEPSPFSWPSVSSQFGILDTCGFAKDAFYYHQACFLKTPMVHVLPHWNHPEGKTVRVVAVSNCDEVELFLNGRSLGKKAVDACAPAEWQVPFEAGELKACALKDGKVVAEDVERTAGVPVRIVAEPYRTYVDDSGEDVMIVNCSVADKDGIPVPTAENHLFFEVEGDGDYLGAGNGDPNSHETDTDPHRRLFAGKCQVIVRVRQDAKAVSLKIKGEGLQSCTVTPEIRHVPHPSYVYSVLGGCVSGLTRSAVTDTRPDPLVKLADNDMNTFMPLQLSAKRQEDFKNGWCIVRMRPELPDKLRNNPHTALHFEDVRCLRIEVYVDGVIQMAAEDVCGSFTSPLYTASKTPDIRVLMHAWDDDAPCGISRTVRLTQR